MGNDYRQTLNLPRTDFPMKAGLPQLEPEIEALWERIDVYRRLQEKSAGRPKYLLHDGPPFSNNNIHLGQALNKILKDIVVRFRSMQGYHAPFVPGWDNHGLATEMRALEHFDLDRHAIDPVELRARCTETANHFIDVQREQFKRLGCLGDWEHPYLTMDPAYEAVTLRVLADMVDRGLVYRGLRPVHWCPTCETALAEAEIEYEEHTSPSIYVKFAMTSEPPITLNIPAGRPVSLLVWTTTPWTLPANVAVAVHPEYEYEAVSAAKEIFILARPLVESSMRECGIERYERLGHCRGSDLEHGVCRHPFLERASVIVLASYVTLDQGTGCVHTAPGHGKEDFETGRQYRLPTIQPLDERGVFTEAGGALAGLRFDQADEVILEDLRKRGNLVASAMLPHAYPFCWRTHEPVIFRATDQWFIGLTPLVEQALKAVDEVRWIPSWGRERMAQMISNRPDWCISRQRPWGVPIPAFYCEACDAPLLTGDLVRAVADRVAVAGSDVWWRDPAESLLPTGTVCGECAGSRFRKETDILDVWFESGCSHAAVCMVRPELGWPADLYLEGGPDQFRGWFQLSLWAGLVLRGQSPYRTVVAHGFFLDETGRKMSKSLGNIVDPQDVSARHGADILRLWVSYVDFKSDQPMSEEIFDQVTEAYRRIRNTVRFMLGNLYDFDPARDGVAREEMVEVDRYLMHRLQEITARVTEAYQAFEFHRVYHTLHSFCAVDLSAFYLDLLKDRLYVSRADSPQRRSAQTVLYHLTSAIVRLLAPVVCHSAEQMWQHLPDAEGREESVTLAPLPSDDPAWRDPELATRWERLLAIRDQVNRAIEQARTSDVIDQPLQASVTLYPADADRSLLASLDGELAAILIVSEARVAAPNESPPDDARAAASSAGLRVAVARAGGKKCQRCWLYLPSVGDDSEHPGLCHRCARIVKEA